MEQTQVIVDLSHSAEITQWTISLLCILVYGEGPIGKISKEYNMLQLLGGVYLDRLSANYLCVRIFK